MQRAHDEAMGGDEPTLPPKPRRRSFSAEYKLAILEDYDACEGDGDKGALLRPRACTPPTSWNGAGPVTPLRSRASRPAPASPRRLPKRRP